VTKVIANGITRAYSETEMPYVVAEPCICVKDTACVDACPADVIHPRVDEAQFAAAKPLYIFPHDCTDCGACVPVCPVSAIYAIEDLPEKWAHFAIRNADWYKQAENGSAS